MDDPGILIVMTDVMLLAIRSRMMASIRARDTSPELVVRSLLHRMGYRFRLHRRDLPGTPDIVLTKWQAVVMVQVCLRRAAFLGVRSPD